MLKNAYSERYTPGGHARSMLYRNSYAAPLEVEHRTTIVLHVCNFT